MHPRVRIISYFSLPTDLAAEFSSWPEFVGGSGYEIDLRSTEGDVRIRYAEIDEEPQLLIYSSKKGAFLERVVEQTAKALEPHSDTVIVERLPEEPISEPTRGEAPRV